jgi:hypothetical protein
VDPDPPAGQRGEGVLVGLVVAHVDHQPRDRVDGERLEEPAHRAALVPVEVGHQLGDPLAVAQGERVGGVGGRAHGLAHAGDLAVGDLPVVHREGEPLALEDDAVDAGELIAKLALRLVHGGHGGLGTRVDHRVLRAGDVQAVAAGVVQVG